MPEDAILRLFLGDTWKTRGILHFIGGQNGNSNVNQEETKGDNVDIDIERLQHQCLNFPTEDQGIQDSESVRKQMFLLNNLNDPRATMSKVIMTSSSDPPLVAALQGESPPESHTTTTASTMLAGSCLQLVAKLLNYSKNKEAEAYNRVFSK